MFFEVHRHYYTDKTYLYSGLGDEPSPLHHGAGQNLHSASATPSRHREERRVVDRARQPLRHHRGERVVVGHLDLRHGLRHRVRRAVGGDEVRVGGVGERDLAVVVRLLDRAGDLPGEDEAQAAVELDLASHEREDQRAADRRQERRRQDLRALGADHDDVVVLRAVEQAVLAVAVHELGDQDRNVAHQRTSGGK